MMVSNRDLLLFRYLFSGRPYSFSGCFFSPLKEGGYPLNRRARITTGNNGGKFLFEAIEFQGVNCDSLEKLFSNP